MEEDKLSTYALCTAKSIALLEQLACTYDRMGDLLKDMSLMSEADIDLDNIGAYAAARIMRDARIESISNLENLPEKEVLEEFLDKMKLHSMWVNK